MAKRITKQALPDFTFFLDLLMALFLLTTGIVTLIHYNSDLSRFGRALGEAVGVSQGPLILIVAIVQVVTGLLFIISLFAVLPARLPLLFGLALVLIMVVEIVNGYFIESLMKPGFLIWLSSLSRELLILVLLWQTTRRRG